MTTDPKPLANPNTPEVTSVRLREPLDIEDRVTWGTAFNVGVDQAGATWSIWLDGAWLVIEQRTKTGTVRRRRAPAAMVRVIDEVVAPARIPAPTPRSVAAISKPKIEKIQPETAGPSGERCSHGDRNP
jgi:hypothetical protein